MYIIMMEEKDFKEVKEIFKKSIIDLEDSGKLAKIIIKNEISAGLQHGAYYVNGVEVTMDNIDSFSYQQLSQSSAEHIEKIISDPNHAISFLW